MYLIFECSDDTLIHSHLKKTKRGDGVYCHVLIREWGLLTCQMAPTIGALLPVNGREELYLN